MPQWSLDLLLSNWHLSFFPSFTLHFCYSIQGNTVWHAASSLISDIHVSIHMSKEGFFQMPTKPNSSEPKEWKFFLCSHAGTTLASTPRLHLPSISIVQELEEINRSCRYFTYLTEEKKYTSLL